MVSRKKVGAVIVGASAVFGAALYFLVTSLNRQSQTLGCMADTPGCLQVASFSAASHIAVGLVSALLSLGVYFLIFYRDSREANAAMKQAELDQKISLLSKVLTDGERSILSAVLVEDGVAQSSLSYKTNLTPGRVSQIVSHFEERGILARESCGKSYKIHLVL